MKKILAILLAIAMVMSMVVVVNAADVEISIGTIENASTAQEVLAITSTDLGETVVVHIIGTSTGAFRVWLSNNTWTRASDIVNVPAGDFDMTIELTAADVESKGVTNANEVQFKGPSYGVNLDGLNVTYCGVFYGTLAEYEEAQKPSYTVTVTDGTADVAEAKEGDTVTVTANAAPYGKQFTGWTAEGVTLDDATATEVTFTMPANNVTLTANYEDIPEEPDVPTEKVLWTYAGDVELPHTVVGENWCAEKDAWDGKTADWNAYYSASIVDGAQLVVTTSATRWFNIFFGNVWNSEPADDLSFWFMLGDYDTVAYNEDGSATHTIDLSAAFAGWEAKATEEGKNYDPATYKSKMMLNFQVPVADDENPAGELTISEMYIYAPAYAVSMHTADGEVEVGTYAVGQTVSITAPAKEGMAFAGWTVLKGDIELNNANAATTTFKMPEGNVVVEPTYEEASGDVRVPGHITSGGYVIMGDEYHALIGNGIIITTPHVFDANNVCIYCGHYVEPVADESEVVVEITDPVEPSTEEEEDVTVDVEEPAEDTNPGTGLALAVVPMLIAAAAVVISKR